MCIYFPDVGQQVQVDSVDNLPGTPRFLQNDYFAGGSLDQPFYFLLGGSAWIGCPWLSAHGVRQTYRTTTVDD